VLFRSEKTTSLIVALAVRADGDIEKDIPMRQIFRSSLFLPYLVFTMNTIARADTIYVHAGATAGANTGDSWQNAYLDLQDALAAAAGNPSFPHRGECSASHRARTAPDRAGRPIIDLSSAVPRPRAPPNRPETPIIKADFLLRTNPANRVE